MSTKPRKRGLSPAQVKYLNEHVPAFMAWLNATGQSIGMTVQPWQKRIVEALIRKKVLEPDGRITITGTKDWEAARRLLELKALGGGLRGKKADLVIVDEVEKTA